MREIAIPVSGRQRIEQIDVLRGLAALGVFVFHVSGAVNFPKRTLPPIELWGHSWANIPSLFTFGATGVSLFFVISGFCLALKPLARGAIDLAQYARERFGRVYPAYFVAVLLSWLVTDLRGIPWSLAEVGSCLLLLQGFIQPWHFSLNGALWSMATEAQFYVAFPLIFAAFARARTSVWLWSLAIAVLAFRLLVGLLPAADEIVGGITTGAFTMNSLPGRVLEFALGMALARAWIADPAAVARLCRWLLVPVVAAAVLVRIHGAGWMGDPAMGLMYVVVLGFAIACMPSPGGGSMLAGFGRASYSFFLLHLPVVSLLADNVAGLEALPPYSRFMALLLMSFAAMLPLSLLMYRYVEIPCWHRFRSSRGVPAGEVIA